MQVDILCTHPMFGPDSGKASWAGLNFMFEKVRIGSGERRRRRADLLLHVRAALLPLLHPAGPHLVPLSCVDFRIGCGHTGLLRAISCLIIKNISAFGVTWNTDVGTPLVFAVF